MRGVDWEVSMSAPGDDLAALDEVTKVHRPTGAGEDGQDARESGNQRGRSVEQVSAAAELALVITRADNAGALQRSFVIRICLGRLAADC